jgi:hypothetical protein
MLLRFTKQHKLSLVRGRLLSSFPRNAGLPEEQFTKLKSKLWHFMETEIYPNEKLFEQQSHDIERNGNEWYEPAIVKELKEKAKQADLWK